MQVQAAQQGREPPRAGGLGRRPNPYLLRDGNSPQCQLRKVRGSGEGAGALFCPLSAAWGKCRQWHRPGLPWDGPSGSMDAWSRAHLLSFNASTVLEAVPATALLHATCSCRCARAGLSPHRCACAAYRCIRGAACPPAILAHESLPSLMGDNFTCVSMSHHVAAVASTAGSPVGWSHALCWVWLRSLHDVAEGICPKQCAWQPSGPCGAPPPAHAALPLHGYLLRQIECASMVHLCATCAVVMSCPACTGAPKRGWPPHLACNRSTGPHLNKLGRSA